VGGVSICLRLYGVLLDATEIPMNPGPIPEKLTTPLAPPGWFAPKNDKAARRSAAPRIGCGKAFPVRSPLFSFGRSTPE